MCVKIFIISNIEYSEFNLSDDYFSTSWVGSIMVTLRNRSCFEVLPKLNLADVHMRSKVFLRIIININR